MMWVLLLVVVVILGLAAAVGSGRWGAMPPLVDDRPSRLPATDHELDADDLRGARFSVVTRGYSMQQVDALLARVANQMDARVENLSTVPAETIETGADQH